MKAVRITAIENLEKMGLSTDDIVNTKRTGFLLDLCKEVAEAAKETINDFQDDNKLGWAEMLTKVNDVIDISRVVARHSEVKQDLLALSNDEDYANDIEQAIKLVLDDGYSTTPLKSPSSILSFIIAGVKMAVDISEDIKQSKES